MCMLTFFPAGVTPDVGALANGAVFNRDGHGFAIVTGKRRAQRIVVQRSMDSEYLIAEFARLRRKYPDGPAMFHSRLSTHGTIGKANCHPFRVGGDKRTVLAHNGVLPSLVQPAKGDPRSDTRIAAEDLLSSNIFGSLATQKARDRVTEWMGHSNKFVILTVDPRFRENAYILNEVRGIWDGDIWYSNDDYLGGYVEWGDWQPMDADYDRCSACGDLGRMNPAGFCEVCGMCADCYEFVDDCVCYVPSALEKAALKGT